MMTQYSDDSQSVPAFRGCSKIPAIMIECYKRAMDESLIFQELLSQREAFPVILVCSGTSRARARCGRNYSAGFEGGLPSHLNEGRKEKKSHINTISPQLTWSDW